MNKHYENIHRYDFLTKELLEEEYLKNGLTDKLIAEKYDMPSKVVVWRKRKQFGIPNRYAAKSNTNATKNRKFQIQLSEAYEMLAGGMNYSQIASAMGCSIIVAKRRFKELGLCKEQDHAEKYKYWNIELTDLQKQMIIGSVLGDGTITKHGAYSCSHSTQQEAYHKHKRDALKTIHSGKFQYATHKAVDVYGVPFESVHFTTGTNKFCSTLQKLYYPHGQKIFPYLFILGNITEKALAYWYMDDGSTYWTKSQEHPSVARLLTYGYSYADQELIQEVFANKFELCSSIDYRRSRGYFQRFPPAETTKLFKLIMPYMIPSMVYKSNWDAYQKYSKDKESLRQIRQDISNFGADE